MAIIEEEFNQSVGILSVCTTVVNSLFDFPKIASGGGGGSRSEVSAAKENTIRWPTRLVVVNKLHLRIASDKIKMQSPPMELLGHQHHHGIKLQGE